MSNCANNNRMKLVFYSGGQSRSNHELHKEVVKLARSITGRNRNRTLQLTYFPFCSDQASLYFHRIRRRFRGHGVERFFCLSVDDSPTADEIKIALQSDIIYLAGGNTFYFQKYLRKTGMLERLASFAKRGGVLAGLSAGGLLMTPTTKMAADPDLEPDENEVGLRNFKAMGLVPFEFSPHFTRSAKSIQAHLAYSKKTKNPIYAVADGGGIIVNGKSIEIIGKASVFYRGYREII